MGAYPNSYIYIYIYNCILLKRWYLIFPRTYPKNSWTSVFHLFSTRETTSAIRENKGWKQVFTSLMAVKSLYLMARHWIQKMRRNKQKKIRSLYFCFLMKFLSVLFSIIFFPSAVIWTISEIINHKNYVMEHVRLNTYVILIIEQMKRNMNKMFVLRTEERKT